MTEREGMFVSFRFGIARILILARLEHFPK
jgi:hypothetical protein